MRAFKIKTLQFNQRKLSTMSITFKTYRKLLTSIAALALCATTPSSYAQSTQQLLQTVSSSLTRTEGLQAQFRQVKQIRGFRTSMVSTGKLVAVNNKGMLWITESPSASTLKITPNGMVENRSGTNTSIDYGSSTKTINTIFSSVLTGNFGLLQQYFNITGSAQSKGAWNLNLIPNSPNMKQAIMQIQVSGARYVQSVRISEANGDQSVITFSQTEAISPGSVSF
jgi:outer membrane lipoprotein-sorting protein